MSKKTNLKVGSYRGIDVMVAGGKVLEFTAQVGTQTFWGVSWDSLVKKMDAAIEFKPFDVAIEERNDAREMVCHLVRITGRVKSFSSGWRFIREGGEEIKHGSMYTAEALPLMIERRRLCDAMEKVKDEYLTKIGEIDEKMNPLAVRADD